MVFPKIEFGYQNVSIASEPFHELSHIRGHMTEISSFALITSFFLRGANERNTR